MYSSSISATTYACPLDTNSSRTMRLRAATYLSISGQRLVIPLVNLSRVLALAPIDIRIIAPALKTNPAAPPAIVNVQLNFGSARTPREEGSSAGGMEVACCGVLAVTPRLCALVTNAGSEVKIIGFSTPRTLALALTWLRTKASDSVKLYNAFIWE